MKKILFSLVFVFGLVIDIYAGITGPTSACVNVQATYQLFPASVVNVSWTVPGGQIISGAGSASIVVVWNSPGTQTLSVEYGLISEENESDPPVHTANLSVTVNSPLNSLTSSGDICANGSVTMNASTGSSYTYQWYNDSGAMSGITYSSYTTSSPGNYHVIITQGSCSVTTNTVSVALNGPSNSIVATGDLCTTGSVTLATTQYNSTYHYQWYNNSGALSGATGSSYTTTSPGNYYAGITQNTCSGTTNTISVSTASCKITGTSPVCVSTQTQYQLGVVATTGISWSVSGGQIISGDGTRTIMVLWSSPGNNSVTVEYGLISEQNESDPPVHGGTLNVTVNGPLNSLTSTGDLCVDGAVTLSASTGSSYTYQWYNGSGVISGATGSSYSAASPGNYYAVITQNSCSNTTNTIVVSSTLCKITGTSPVCVNTQTQYQLGVVASTGISWSVSGGQIILGAGTKVITVAWNSPGTQTVSVEYGLISEEHESDPPIYSASLNVTVNGPQNSLTSTGNICSDGAVTLNASTGTSYTYQWYNDSGVISGASGSSYAAASPGNYYAVITQSGCSNTTNSITVSNALCTITGPLSACVGTQQQYQLGMVASIGIVWTVSGGQVISGAGTRIITVLWNSPGGQNVSVEYGLISEEHESDPPIYFYSLPVTILGSPVAITPSTTQTICNPSVSLLSATTGSGFTYQWYNDSGAIAGATNATFNAGAGNYYVTLTVGGCTSQSSTVSVTSLGCQINTTPPIYANQETVLTYSGVLGTNPSWGLGDGIITKVLGANSIKVKWLNGGSRTVTYTSQLGTDQFNNPVENTVSANVVVIEQAATIASDEFSSPPDSVNFVKTTDFLVEGITDNMSINSVSSTNYLQSTEYIDGHGRSVQTVHRNQSPLGNDLVQLVQYDVFNREPRKYLPIVTGSDGSYKTGIFDTNGQLLNNFYSNTNTKIASDAVPFAETVFEPSPLNRVQKQGAPGTNWQPDSNPNSTTDHTVKHHYEFNGATDIILFTYDPTTGLVSTGAGSAPGYYGANQLVANRSTDEQQNDVIEYVDKKGHTICKKVQSGTSAGVKLYTSTYYIYDNLNNLVVVLPPEAINSALSSLTKS